MSEIDELDRCRAAYTLFSKLKKAEEQADKEGWISADELEKELSLFVICSNLRTKVFLWKISKELFRNNF